MAGAYCKFCNQRCFVYRQVIVAGELIWAGHMATCHSGRAWDRSKLGVDFEGAHNPLDKTSSEPGGGSVLSLAEALAALPDTADGIAAHLAELGIGGMRKDDCNCPIAVYLTSVELEAPTVTEVGVSVLIDGREVFEPTPDAVEKFVRRFDQGEWPDLEIA